MIGARSRGLQEVIKTVGEGSKRFEFENIIVG